MKPEFDQKLRALGIRAEFINNFMKSWPNVADGMDALAQCETWEELIAAAFQWTETPEGVEYWREISKL